MLSFKRFLRCFFLLLALVSVAPLAGQQPADKKAALSKFIRLQRNADGMPAALETAVVRYVPASGKGAVAVDLVSVVHLGDREYYQKLNKHFEQYDVLLYELVAQPGARPAKGGQRDIPDPFSLLQHLIKIGLGLEHQLEQIDYTKRNFVHADLSPEEMLKAAKERGEDPMTLALGILTDALREQNKNQKTPKNQPPDIDLKTLLTDPDGLSKLKKSMAVQLAESGDAGLGPTLSNLIIADRNQAAIKVLQRELGKGHKTIGIFYGAAHMPDFERRLRDDHDLKRSSEQWFTAWDLTCRARPLGIEDIFKLLK